MATSKDERTSKLNPLDRALPNSTQLFSQPPSTPSAAVSQDDPEQTQELGSTDDRLDSVQRANLRLAGVLDEQNHNLELAWREANGEDALEVTRLSNHRVHLHRAGADFRRQVEEVAMATAIAVNRMIPATTLRSPWRTLRAGRC